MRILAAEDDYTCRRVLQKHLKAFGHVDFVVNGQEAIQAFVLAWKDEDPYDLVCLDIMMPEMDGQEALQSIRALEKEMGIVSSKEVKVMMVTALGDPKNVFDSYSKGAATAYLVKPVRKNQLLEELHKMGFVEKSLNQINS